MKITFSKTNRELGDMHVDIFVDGTPAGHMRKNWDGDEWYSRAEAAEFPDCDALRRGGLDDADLGTTLAGAKRQVREWAS